MTMPTPPQHVWSNYVSQEKLNIKSEARLSTDSQDTARDKKGSKLKQSGERGGPDTDNGLDGQPAKKRGKGKGKNNKDPNAPKRVFTCPHCNVSWLSKLHLSHLISSSKLLSKIQSAKKYKC